MRESFVFYKSFYDAIQKLPEEYQLELFNAIMKYNFEEELPKMSPVVEAMFTLVKTNIDKATERYERCVKNGKKGGRPKTETKPKKNLNKTKEKPKQNQEHNQEQNLEHNLNVNDNDNVNVNDNIIYLFKEKINKKKEEVKKEHQSFQVYLLMQRWIKEQPEYLELTDEEQKKILMEV